EPSSEFIADIEQAAGIVGEHPLELLGRAVHRDETRMRWWRPLLCTRGAVRWCSPVRCRITHRIAPRLVDSTCRFRIAFMAGKTLAPSWLGFALQNPALLDHRPQCGRLAGARAPDERHPKVCRLDPIGRRRDAPRVADP